MPDSETPSADDRKVQDELNSLRYRALMYLQMYKQYTHIHDKQLLIEKITECEERIVELEMMLQTRCSSVEKN
jgi:hypothetical protein